MFSRPDVHYSLVPSEDKSSGNEIKTASTESKSVTPTRFAEATVALTNTIFSDRGIMLVSIFDSILYAGYDASGVIMGLEDMEDMSDDTLSKYLGISIEHLKIVVPLIFSIYSFTLNYPSLVAGLKNSIIDFKTWHSGEPLEFIPDGFCHNYSCCLSQDTKIKLAVGTILFIGAFAAAADGIFGDYFIANAKKDVTYLNGIPDIALKIFSVYCSYVVAKMTFFTETPEVKKFFFRALLNDNQEPTKLRPFLKKMAHYLFFRPSWSW